MKKSIHRIYIGTMALIVLITVLLLSFKGFSYYNTGLTERFYHPNHELFKASGSIGHGIGILGTLLIVIGVFGYMARKRYRSLSRLGLLKHWLEFHIFLCTEGAILILFHTSFKFGGIVAISFWSMVAVVLSGIIGRFIYLQIPRTLEGRELSLVEVVNLRNENDSKSSMGSSLEEDVKERINDILEQSRTFKANLIKEWGLTVINRKKIRDLLKKSQLKRFQRKEIFASINKEMKLNIRIKRLESMQKLFRYWHVAHLPFALIMLVIAVIHVGIALLFGYKWIF